MMKWKSQLVLQAGCGGGGMDRYRFEWAGWSRKGAARRSGWRASELLRTDGGLRAACAPTPGEHGGARLGPRSGPGGAAYTGSRDDRSARRGSGRERGERKRKGKEADDKGVDRGRAQLRYATEQTRKRPRPPYAWK